MVEVIRDFRRGKVKVFFAEKGRRYGFLQVIDDEGKPTGEADVWFHLNDGLDILEGPTFNTAAWPEPAAHWDNRTVREPRAGSILIFDIVPGSKGSKACPWGHERVFIRAKAISSRVDYKIVDENGVRLWAGKYSELYGRIESTLGKLPAKLGPGHKVMRYIIENPYRSLDDDYRAYWEELPDQAFTMDKLRVARPMWP